MKDENKKSIHASTKKKLSSRIFKIVKIFCCFVVLMYVTNFVFNVIAGYKLESTISEIKNQSLSGSSDGEKIASYVDDSISSIYTDAADKAIKRYEMAKSTGDYLNMCYAAKDASSSLIQIQDSRYAEWSGKEKSACGRYLKS